MLACRWPPAWHRHDQTVPGPRDGHLGLDLRHPALTQDRARAFIQRACPLGRPSTPHRKGRWAVARLLGVDEVYLWPELLVRFPGRQQISNCSELVELFPDRASVPRQVWLYLLGEALEKVDVLVFSNTFFAQTQPQIAAMLTEAARRVLRSGCALATRLRCSSHAGPRRGNQRHPVRQDQVIAELLPEPAGHRQVRDTVAQHDVVRVVVLSTATES
jgi:hypothetical protein